MCGSPPTRVNPPHLYSPPATSQAGEAISRGVAGAAGAAVAGAVGLAGGLAHTALDAGGWWMPRGVGSAFGQAVQAWMQGMHPLQLVCEIRGHSPMLLLSRPPFAVSHPHPHPWSPPAGTALAQAPLQAAQAAVTGLARTAGAAAGAPAEAGRLGGHGAGAATAAAAPVAGAGLGAAGAGLGKLAGVLTGRGAEAPAG